MRCPIDDAPLREVTRQTVKIDLCPECRGVWLDRGELDHLLEVSADVDDDRGDRGSGRESSRAPESRSAPRYDADRSRDPRARRDDDDDDDDDRRRGIAPGSPPAKKRKNWLSEIFELGE